MKHALLNVFGLLSLATVLSVHAAAPKKLEVTLLVFSGRPNPVLEITDPKEIAEILAAAQALPVHPTLKAADPVHPPRLGYGGVAVKNLSDSARDVTGFVLYRGNVQLQRQTDPRTSKVINAWSAAKNEPRHDVQGALERRLLTLMRDRGVITEGLLEDTRK